MRLIDADKLKEYLDKKYSFGIDLKFMLFDEIDNQPTAYDVDKVEEALEKQRPRELTSIRKVKQYDGYDMGNCSVCGEPLDNSFYENLKYCCVCGQAIKWE